MDKFKDGKLLGELTAKLNELKAYRDKPELSQFLQVCQAPTCETVRDGFSHLDVSSA